MRELVLGGLRRVYTLVKGQSFATSGDYWQSRYLRGETSGPGSYGRLAKFKAAALNEVVAERSIASVIELGCGDGAQLAIARYPAYLGVDVSPAAVAVCRKRFAGDATKSFIALDEFRTTRPTADLALSLDVIYHLVEDSIFDGHLRDLFGAATRFAAIYSSNSDRIIDPAPHVRHREFTRWIAQNAPAWHLVRTYKNPYPYRWWNRKNSSHCDLFLFERMAAA
jgi:SAM-dependent methyltransferase